HRWSGRSCRYPARTRHRSWRRWRHAPTRPCARPASLDRRAGSSQPGSIAACRPEYDRCPAVASDPDGLACRSRQARYPTNRYAQLGRPLPGFLGNEGEEIHHHLDGTDEMVLAQLIVLGGHASGAVVQMADAQVLAAQGNHWRGTETEAFGPKNSRLDHVKAGF